MAAPKGHRIPNAPRGRQAGSLNKFTGTAREMFQKAAEGMGGLPALQKWAIVNPTEFYKLYARLIPVAVAGEGGTGPVQTIVKHIYSEHPPTKV